MTTAEQERLVDVETVGGSTVPDGDLTHFVSDLVDAGALDLSAIYAADEEERGFPPYDRAVDGQAAHLRLRQRRDVVAEAGARDLP